MSFARYPDGRPLYAVAVLGDVTEQRRAEEHLLKAQQMESVGLLAGGIAHDFNNLLTSVLGNATLAMQAVPTDSAMHRTLESIIASGERAAHLTGQLLAYAGKGGAWPGWLDLSEMVRDAVELVLPSIPGEIKIHTDLKDRLPPLYADRSQIVQLITNLLMNSAEAIEDRVGVITISTDLLTVPEGEPLPVAAVGDVQPGTFLLLLRERGSTTPRFLASSTRSLQRNSPDGVSGCRPSPELCGGIREQCWSQARRERVPL